MSVSWFSGIKVFSSPLAVTLKIWHTVERASARTKRRKGWQVVKHREERPAILQTAQGLLVHPSLYEQLRKQVGATQQ